MNEKEYQTQFELEKAKFFEAHPDCPHSEPIEVLNLIMRKEFAEEILKGEKKVEVRAYSKFYYDRLFDRKVLEWGEKHCDTDELAADFVDFAEPLRQVKTIRFSNYDKTWFLDVECVENYQLAVVKEQVAYLQEAYDCHEFDELLSDLDKKKAKDRPMYFWFAIGNVLDTNLR